MTKDKTVNGQMLIPLYLGDNTPRKKIQCKDDLEEESGDTDFHVFDIMNQH